jgi:hypothetical protein
LASECAQHRVSSSERAAKRLRLVGCALNNYASGDGLLWREVMPKVQEKDGEIAFVEKISNGLRILLVIAGLFVMSFCVL